MSGTILMILEIAGTAAFAVSGAMMGIRKQMDLLGVLILGIITAVGGGILRDIILGITPPLAFRDPLYTGIAAFVAAAVFFAVKNQASMKGPVYETVMLIMDSVGLGVFTVIGINTAMENDRDYGAFLLVFVGVITGVGGGLVRDMMAGEKPYIFVKHFYACSSIIGAAVCVEVWKLFGSAPAMIAGTAAVIILRVCAAAFRWSLPKIENLPSDMKDGR